jgi:hypothetical protein
LFVVAGIGPIFNLTKERNEVPLGVLIGISALDVVTFLIISVVTLTQSGDVTSVTTLMGAAAAASMVGIGWVVQHQSSARASRRAHTFNILMQSRLSAEFQNQVRKRADLYSAGNPVAPEDAKLASKGGLDKVIAEIEVRQAAELERARDESRDRIKEEYAARIELTKRKFLSLEGMKYLLNFYEFMSAGIVLRELDERLLRETVSDMVVALYNDSLHIRLTQRTQQPEVFINLDRVVGPIWPNP